MKRSLENRLKIMMCNYVITNQTTSFPGQKRRVMKIEQTNTPLNNNTLTLPIMA